MSVTVDAKEKWDVVLQHNSVKVKVKEENMDMQSTPSHGPLYKLLKGSFVSHWRGEKRATRLGT